MLSSPGIADAAVTFAAADVCGISSRFGSDSIVDTAPLAVCEPSTAVPSTVTGWTAGTDISESLVHATSETATTAARAAVPIRADRDRRSTAGLRCDLIVLIVAHALGSSFT